MRRKQSAVMVLALTSALLWGGCGGGQEDKGGGGSKGSSTTSGSVPTSGSGPTTTSGVGASTTTTSGGGQSTCTESAQCAGDDVCISNGTCAYPWGRVWRIAAHSVTVASSNPSNGEAWDALGGAPDPFAQIVVGSNLIGQTPTVDDTFDAEWNQYGDSVVTQDSGDIGVYVYDEDISTHDYVIGSAGTPDQWLPFLKDGGVGSITDNGSALYVYIIVL